MAKMVHFFYPWNVYLFITSVSFSSVPLSKQTILNHLIDLNTDGISLNIRTSQRNMQNLKVGGWG